MQKERNVATKKGKFSFPATKVPFYNDVFTSRYCRIKSGAVYVQFAPKCLGAICSLENCGILTHHYGTKGNYISSYTIVCSRYHFILPTNEPFMCNKLCFLQIMSIYSLFTQTMYPNQLLKLIMFVLKIVLIGM